MSASAKRPPLASDPGPTGQGLGRLLFLGSGAFAVPLLAAVAPMAGDLLVLSRPDRPAGRGLSQRASPVAAWARDQDLRLAQPTRLRSPAAEEAAQAFGPDGLLLAAYGQLVPPSWLTLAPRPPLNVHPSLLPRHRGADPVASTILAGDERAGVTLMVMTAELDAGPIVGQWSIPLSGREEAPALEAELADLAARVIPPELLRWAAGALEPVAQDERASTLIKPFGREDGRIDWSRPAIDIDRQVRALQPWPGAWTLMHGRRLHVRRAHPDPGLAGVPIGVVLPGLPSRVACGVGALVLDEVQPEGKGRMSGEAWQRGVPRQHLLLGA